MLRVAREHDVDVLSRAGAAAAADAAPRSRRRARAVPAARRSTRERGAGGVGRAVATALASDDGADASASAAEVRLAVPGAPPVRRQGRASAPAGQRAPPRRAGAARSRRCRARTRAATSQILAGDFNATLDHAEFRALLDRGYVDAADAVGDGLTPTWPARRAAARAAADDRPRARRPARAGGARDRREDPALRPPRRDRGAALTLRIVCARDARSLAAALVVALLSVPLAVMVLGALHAPGEPPPVGWRSSRPSRRWPRSSARSSSSRSAASC